ncbi:MAG: class I SAM-dependent methyltransferase [Thermodesulfobacteriota bacterium]|nr:class I SAM-dependent methyltransferase [Thermodesulfobacteriota bacterium]
MGYIFEFSDARDYDQWFETRKNRYTFDLEIQLLAVMLSTAPGTRLLDIGCGTGKSLKGLMDYYCEKFQLTGSPFHLTGIDPSPYMLDIAKQRLGAKADLYRGFAEDLPFEDNAFDYALLFTTLEFTEKPAKAIEEACRVAKNRVFIVVLNKYAPFNILKKIKGFFISSLVSRARCFSVWELKKIVFAILGRVPVAWKTTPQCPWIRGRIPMFFERLYPVQKLPFGSVIIMAISPVPKFRMRPMPLKIKKSSQYNTARGFARESTQEVYEDLNF